MSLVYRSNAPEYFRYIATIYSREEIEANPQLCTYLEDPYLKDDMELALAFNNAENGGYEDKREFIQYLLANGPELDAATIMYYRNIILNDPEYDFIANAEFNDISVVDEARETIYDKPTKKDDCFRNPCNYLGPFSVSMAKIGDNSSFKTLRNMFSSVAYRDTKAAQGKADKAIKEADEEKKKAEEEKKNAKDEASKKKADEAIKAADEKKKKAEEDKKKANAAGEEEGIMDSVGDIATNLWNRLIPNIQVSYTTLCQATAQQYNEFAEHLALKKVNPNDIPGDPSAVNRAMALTPLVQFHLHQKMGDCARLWQHMRMLNLYDPKQNIQAPVDEKGNKSVTGVPQAGINPTDTDTVGGGSNPKTKTRKAANGGKSSGKSGDSNISLYGNNSTLISGNITNSAITKHPGVDTKTLGRVGGSSGLPIDTINGNSLTMGGGTYIGSSYRGTIADVDFSANRQSVDPYNTEHYNRTGQEPKQTPEQESASYQAYLRGREQTNQN